MMNEKVNKDIARGEAKENQIIDLKRLISEETELSEMIKTMADELIKKQCQKT